MALTPFGFDGAHAVLTGAASGMGEQMAYQLAERGTHLVLIDRDAARLEAVARRVRERRPALAVHTEVADLADVSLIPALIDRILAVSPSPALLINNAGVALGGRFSDVTAEEFDWVMAVNFRAPVALCRGLLPELRQSPGSHIVNVSSVYGLIGVAGQSAYSASRYALRGFSEVLRQELAPEGIGVTVVHPGGVRTRIAETARVAAGISAEEEKAGKEAFEKLLTYPADKAATAILEGVRKRRPRVLIAASAVVPDLVVRLLPARYPRVLRLLQGRSRRHAVPASDSTLGGSAGH
ncbi:SDR family NAD(P)-dependent oxidoreductase [Nocardia brevicatena]|uniref:SDR family NAD(P)-dependent oxidoreductase n=1 Tax=Nocardia brevicatena TaxID=37327 RepID=UPI0002FE5817|nr:SDR family NAD(P)-dependent oxidoreductase [Nocardia brevicatena]